MKEQCKWKYITRECWFEVTKVSGIINRKKEGKWSIMLERKYSLEEGLNHLGEMGYELVGIQASSLYTSQLSTWYEPWFIYIFKKLENEKEEK